MRNTKQRHAYLSTFVLYVLFRFVYVSYRLLPYMFRSVVNPQSLSPARRVPSVIACRAAPVDRIAISKATFL